MARALRWRLPYWLRVAPGARGAIIHAILPSLFFLPLEALALFDERPQAVLALLWCMAVALGLVLGSGRSLRSEDAVWLVQRGFRMSDASLEDWILDVGLLALASAWWGGIGALALADGSSPFRNALALMSFAFATGVVTRTLAGLLSAWGARRPSDVTGVLAILALLAPVLTLGRHPGLKAAAEWLLPPFSTAGKLVGAIRVGELAGAAGALLHIAIFVVVLLVATAWRMARWMPKG